MHSLSKIKKLNKQLTVQGQSDVGARQHVLARMGVATRVCAVPHKTDTKDAPRLRPGPGPTVTSNGQVTWSTRDLLVVFAG